MQFVKSVRRAQLFFGAAKSLVTLPPARGFAPPACARFTRWSLSLPRFAVAACGAEFRQKAA
jgi:hypothetical protein